MSETQDRTTTEFVRLAEGIYLEGLGIDHERAVVWYSDVIAGGVHGVRADGTPAGTLNPGRMWTGGVMMNADGAVLSSGQGGIMWNRPDTGASGWLITRLDDCPVNGINEMWPDGRGGLFFGTNDIEHVIEALPSRPTRLYHLSRDRRLTRLADGLAFSNGIAFDAERSRFYCSDTFGKGWTWDVATDAQGGFSLTNKRILLDRDDCDGMALDGEGNIWIPGVFSPGIIRRLTPEGNELEPIRTPPGTTTQVRFGGADGRDAYITLVPEDAGQCLKDGLPLTGSSALWRFRSPVAGVKLAPTAFDLG